jgi:hypothetical protein
MTKRTMSELVFGILACCTFQTTAIAGNSQDQDRGNSLCDVVSLNGTGKLLEDGRIVGTETLSIIGTEKQIRVEFTATPLAALEVDHSTGAVTLATTHDFTGVDNRSVNFTTFDEITIVPLGGSDATCIQNACGLIFKLKLEKGHGRYNCGETASGFNTDPAALIPFTSFVNPLSPAPNGDTVILNSLGKLCKCSGNN